MGKFIILHANPSVKFNFEQAIAYHFFLYSGVSCGYLSLKFVDKVLNYCQPLFKLELLFIRSLLIILN